MTDFIWTEAIGDGPVIATAIHDGHQVREEVVKLFSLGDKEREREEDPYTGIGPPPLRLGSLGYAADSKSISIAFAKKPCTAFPKTLGA